MTGHIMQKMHSIEMSCRPFRPPFRLAFSNVTSILPYPPPLFKPKFRPLSNVPSIFPLWPPDNKEKVIGNGIDIMDWNLRQIAVQRAKQMLVYNIHDYIDDKPVDS